MGDLLIHARASCQQQTNGSWVASSSDVPVMATGRDRDEALLKLQAGMNQLTRWWMKQSREEYEQWIASLRERGVVVELLDPGSGELTVPLLAHA